jgi:hypothetical protein
VIDGARQVFMSRLSGGGFTEPEPLSRAEPATYPAVAFSGGALIAAWTEGPPESSRIEVRRLPLDEEPAG